MRRFFWTGVLTFGAKTDIIKRNGSAERSLSDDPIPSNAARRRCGRGAADRGAHHSNRRVDGVQMQVRVRQLRAKILLPAQCPDVPRNAGDHRLLPVGHSVPRAHDGRYHANGAQRDGGDVPRRTLQNRRVRGLRVRFVRNVQHGAMQPPRMRAAVDGGVRDRRGGDGARQRRRRALGSNPQTIRWNCTD